MSSNTHKKKKKKKKKEEEVEEEEEEGEKQADMNKLTTKKQLPMETWWALVGARSKLR